MSSNNVEFIAAHRNAHVGKNIIFMKFYIKSPFMPTCFVKKARTKQCRFIKNNLRQLHQDSLTRWLKRWFSKPGCYDRRWFFKPDYHNRRKFKSQTRVPKRRRDPYQSTLSQNDYCFGFEGMNWNQVCAFRCSQNLI